MMWLCFLSELWRPHLFPNKARLVGARARLARLESPWFADLQGSYRQLAASRWAEDCVEVREIEEGRHRRLLGWKISESESGQVCVYRLVYTLCLPGCTRAWCLITYL